jgi:hypothetical protein
VPQLPFFFLGQVGIAKDVHNATTLHNAVRADHLGHWHDGGNLYDGNTGLFEFGRDRSTAARAGASRGGQNHGLYPFGLELLGDLPPQTAAIGDRVGEPRR